MPKTPSDLSMYLPDKIASARIGNFAKEKHPSLSKAIGRTESLYSMYTLQEFVALLEASTTGESVSGLRIYFATYQKLEDGTGRYNNSLIPVGMEDTLTLVYATTKEMAGNAQVDTGDYYILDPAGNVVDLTRSEDPDIAQRWTSYYYNLKCTLLTDLINAGTLELGNRKLETQCMFYDITAIQELIDYLTNKDGESIGLPPAVFAFFAAYGTKEKSNDGIYDLSDKLMLVFCFMDEFKGYFYYENDESSVDTGNPCPPPGCEGALLSYP